METAFHPLAWTTDSIAAIDAWPSPISTWGSPDTSWASPNNTTAPPSTPTSATLPSFPTGTLFQKFGQTTPPHESPCDHEKPLIQGQVLETPSTERRRTLKERIPYTAPYRSPSLQTTNPPKRGRGRPKIQPAIATSNLPSNREIYKEKNRVAAQKCRKRQKHYIQDLETRGRKVTTTNKRLKEQVAMLTNELLTLKNEVLNHAACGIEGMDDYLNRCTTGLLASKSDRSSSVAGASKSGSPVSVESKSRSGSMMLGELIKGV